jgi:pyruvate dehydrogenase phosphatase
LKRGLSVSSYPANKPTEDRAAVARATIEVDSNSPYCQWHKNKKLNTGDTDSGNNNEKEKVEEGLRDYVDGENYDEHVDIYCVFDGHGGYQVADYASEMLIPHVINFLRDSHPSTATDPKYINNDVDPNVRFIDSLKQSFQRVERDLIGALKPAFELGFGNVARVGACALVAILKDNECWVANAGDCACVLGSINGDRLTSATILSNEHNCKHAAEKDRLKESHPDEMIAGLVRCKSSSSCYVKGHLQPTRSLGDLYLKYGEFRPGLDQNSALLPYTQKDPARSRRVRSPFSPPYILSEPEVQHITLTDNDDFLILASDGLWDEMTPQEAVHHLYQWKRSREGKAILTASSRRQEQDTQNEQQQKEALLSPSDYLIRKALEHAANEAGQNFDLVRNIPQGKRRQIHDDITVVVVELKKER